jgi:nitroimidazol reductase NimA-like FMN-containing flavoprotein (pyridoxamine 5'-phosphate oxidase superfamily)
MRSGPVRDFIDVSRVARLATVDVGGQPHNVPICPILAQPEGDAEERVFFGTGEGRKVRNLRENARVCIVFDDYTEFWNELRQVLLFGTAEIIDGSDPRYLGLRDAHYAKYPQYVPMAGGLEPEDSVIIGVTIDRVVPDGFGDDVAELP